MDVIFIIILFLSGILVSKLINHFLPFLTLPLIQIIIGFFIGLTPIGHDIHLDHEVIMILIIAPILYNEAKNADTTMMYKNLRSIMFLAFPMVIITVFILGWLFNISLPLVPMAACFALAASLSPTDLVTVSSLSKRMEIPEKDKLILEGEGLINDASGITAFQIATLALISGSFSITQASISLVYISIGGVVIGVIVELIKKGIVHIMRVNGIEDTSFFLILEITLPFLTYTVAEHFGVSGVLAVVTIGILKAMSLKRNTLFDARVDDLSNSVWKTLTTILNSLVFLYLGDQLPIIIEGVDIANSADLVKYILIIVGSTVVLFLIRFIILTLYHYFEGGRASGFSFKQQLIMTFSGVKGTITLATITSLPFVLANGETFIDRSLVIFIASGVIILSILIAIVILPIILDKKEEESTVSLEIKIANLTIEQLKENITVDNEREINDVIRMYHNRIKKLKMQNNNLSIRKQIKLEKEILRRSLIIEQQQLEDLLQNNEIDDETFEAYSRFLRVFSRRNNRMFYLKLLIGGLFFKKNSVHRHKINADDKILHHYDSLKEIFIHNHLLVIDMLKSLENDENEAFIKSKIADEEKTIKLLENDKLPTIRNINVGNKFNQEIELGFQLERSVIQTMFEDGEIDYEQAMGYKQNINLMEKYYLDEDKGNLTYYILDKIKERDFIGMKDK